MPVQSRQKPANDGRPRNGVKGTWPQSRPHGHAPKTNFHPEMPQINPNANDPNFKSLLSKLMSAGWVDMKVDTPKTSNSIRDIGIHWSDKGQMCRLAIKQQIKTNPLLWIDANAFLASLNEYEEAFFYQVALSDVPDRL